MGKKDLNAKLQETTEVVVQVSIFQRGRGFRRKVVHLLRRIVKHYNLLLLNLICCCSHPQK